MKLSRRSALNIMFSTVTLRHQHDDCVCFHREKSVTTTREDCYTMQRRIRYKIQSRNSMAPVVSLQSDGEVLHSISKYQDEESESRQTALCISSIKRLQSERQKQKRRESPSLSSEARGGRGTAKVKPVLAALV